jgi:hypothetical protein
VGRHEVREVEGPARHRAAMRRALLAVLVVVAVVLLVAGTLYASDYGVGATITQHDRDGSGYFIVATTGFGYSVKKDLPLEQWAALSVGNFVVYHIASGHTQVYDKEGGRLLYSA